jgi:hypothetical protein
VSDAVPDSGVVLADNQLALDAGGRQIHPRD